MPRRFASAVLQWWTPLTRPPRGFRFSELFGRRWWLWRLRIRNAGRIAWERVTQARRHKVGVGILGNLFPEPTSGEVTIVDLEKWWPFLLALLAGKIAPRHERAHVRQIDQIRRQAADGLELFL